MASKLSIVLMQSNAFSFPVFIVVSSVVKNPALSLNSRSLLLEPQSHHLILPGLTLPQPHYLLRTLIRPTICCLFSPVPNAMVGHHTSHWKFHKVITSFHCIRLKEGMATHSSILAWRIPMNRGAWWATVHGVAKSRTRLSN